VRKPIEIFWERKAIPLYKKFYPKPKEGKDAEAHYPIFSPYFSQKTASVLFWVMQYRQNFFSSTVATGTGRGPGEGGIGADGGGEDVVCGSLKER
jgi:hypothetical protein